MMEVPDLATLSMSKEERYRELDGQMAAVLAGEADEVALFANAASLLFHGLPDLNWAGFYLLRGGELVVGPFQGRLACARIPLGRGVCGSAAAMQRTLVVPDVEAFDGHIACDSRSRSELVVPMLRSTGGLIGVIDLDSPTPARFDAEDAAGLEQVARTLVGLLEAAGA